MGLVQGLLYAIIFCSTARAEPCEALREKHVCVVGGGMAAASTAHFLAQSTSPPRVTVFETSDRVGGRIASIELGKKMYAEAGASVIAAENKLVASFANLLGLPHAKRVTYDSRSESGSKRNKYMGIWDGEEFRIVTIGSSWLDPLLMIWRYGLSLLKMKRHVSALLNAFDGLYFGDDCCDETVEELLERRAPGLYALTQQSFASSLADSLSPLLSSELVSAITRVNYGQDVDEMSGLAGAVSIAGSGGGLWSVEGGNVQLVEGLLARANATTIVNLNARVERVRRAGRGDAGFVLQIVSSDGSDNFDAACDAVVIATSFEMAGLTVDADIVHPPLWIVGRSFQRTIATFIRGRLRPSYFGLADGEGTPTLVVTTAHAPTPFTSIGRIGDFAKVFSKELLTAEILADIFEDGAEVVQTFDWLAYPKFQAMGEKFARFQMADGIFYTSTIESAASAMEMSAISGRAVAALVTRSLEMQPRTQSSSLKDEL
jgi:prenylcysteine oxidase / farnesylcysteine lyase